MTKTPAHKLRLGLITATIWDNDGFYSVDLARSYKDNQGAWQSTNTNLKPYRAAFETPQTQWLARRGGASLVVDGDVLITVKSA